MYDFSFLAPCPSSGLILNGSADRVAPPDDVVKLVTKLKTQKGITITHTVMDGANHFFDKQMDDMVAHVTNYVGERVMPPPIDDLDLDLD